MKVLVIKSPVKIGRKAINRILSGYVIDEEPHPSHEVVSKTINQVKREWKDNYMRVLVYRGKTYHHHDLPIYKYKVNESGEMVLDFSLTEKSRFFVVDHEDKPVQWASYSLDILYTLDQWMELRFEAEVISKDEMKTRVEFPENYLLKDKKGSYKVVGKLFARAYILDWDIMSVEEIKKYSTGDYLTETTQLKKSRDSDDDDDEERHPFFGTFFGRGGRLEHVKIEPPKDNELAINLPAGMFRRCKYVRDNSIKASVDFAKYMRVAKSKAELEKLADKLGDEHRKWQEHVAEMCKEVGKPIPYKSIMNHSDKYPEIVGFVNRQIELGYTPFLGDFNNITPLVFTNFGVNNKLEQVYYDTFIFTDIRGNEIVDVDRATPLWPTNIYERLVRVKLTSGAGILGYLTFIKYT